MPVIELSTLIDAPRERVFDLARSIDAHQASTEGTREKAVGGITSGLIGPGEEVTWEARHFEGAFKYMAHEHTFEEFGGKDQDDGPLRVQDAARISRRARRATLPHELYAAFPCAAKRDLETNR